MPPISRTFHYDLSSGFRVPMTQIYERCSATAGYIPRAALEMEESLHRRGSGSRLGARSHPCPSQPPATTTLGTLDDDDFPHQVWKVYFNLPCTPPNIVKTYFLRTVPLLLEHCQFLLLPSLVSPLFIRLLHRHSASSNPCSNPTSHVPRPTVLTYYFDLRDRIFRTP